MARKPRTPSDSSESESDEHGNMDSIEGSSSTNALRNNVPEVPEIESDVGSEEEDDGEGEEGGEVTLDDVESVDEDAVPRQKIVINDKTALDRIRETIQLDPSLPWTETLVLSYPHTIDVNVEDDLNRELAFYKQALHGAQEARTIAAKHNLPFTRPSDYFAEMVKSDTHMERIRQRLLDESAGIKRSEEKRKEREGKKFGKQVQLEKLKERERGKKEMAQRLKSLKRKRGDMLDKSKEDGDAFDIAVEDAISDRPAKRSKLSRKARDQKFGFGGGKRRAKQNTRESTDNFGPASKKGKQGGGSGKPKGGKSKRPGKSRRMAARNKS